MTSLNTMFYTYIHRTADTNEVFYVGKGKNKRASDKNNRNVWWHRKVNKHGYIVEIVAYWPTETEALQHEFFLIQCFEAMNITLTNIFKALGKERNNKKVSPESCKNYSKGRKKWWAAMSPEEKLNRVEILRKANLGRTLSDERKKALSVFRTGRPNPKACKPVLCVTTGEFFKSVSEAAIKTVRDPAHIVKCCKGKAKATKGLEFAYV